MGKWLWVTDGFRLRDLVVVLTLFSHPMVTFDVPVLSDPSSAVATKYGTYAPSAKPGED